MFSMVYGCCFPCSQSELVTDDKEYFAVGITAHSVQWIIVPAFALKNGQFCLEAGFQLSEHLLALGGTKYRQQATACGSCTLYTIFRGGKNHSVGKGASGAAIECMNIMLGNEPTLGLDI